MDSVTTFKYHAGSTVAEYGDLDEEITSIIQSEDGDLDEEITSIIQSA